MENWEERSVKSNFSRCLVEREEGKKSGGAWVFSFWAHQNIFTSNLRKNWRENLLRHGKDKNAHVNGFVFSSSPPPPFFFFIFYLFLFRCYVTHLSFFSLFFFFFPSSFLFFIFFGFLLLSLVFCLLCTSRL